MAIDIFEPLKDLQGNKQKGASWYRNAVSLITDRSSPSELFAGGKLLGRPSAGRMSMFFYDPKTKARLPCLQMLVWTLFSHFQTFLQFMLFQSFYLKKSLMKLLREKWVLNQKKQT